MLNDEIAIESLSDKEKNLILLLRKFPNLYKAIELAFEQMKTEAYMLFDELKQDKENFIKQYGFLGIDPVIEKMEDMIDELEDKLYPKEE